MNNILLLEPLFLLVILAYIFCIIFCKSRISNSYFSNVELLKKVYKRGFNYIRVIEFLIVILLSIALSEPVLKKVESKNKKEGIDIVLALDLSVSMLDDNKFNEAKKTLKEFIKKRKDDNLALIAFANRALIASPLSNNQKGLLTTLEYIKPGVAGNRDTAIYEALYKSATLLEKSKAKSKVVVLLTDGINTIKRVPLEVAIKKLKKYNIKVYTIAIGSDGDFNKKELSYIAKQLNGSFFSTNKPKELKKIYEKINSLEKSKSIKESISYYKPLYYYPLIFALILMLLFAYLKRDDKKALILIATSAIFAIFALFNPVVNKLKSKNKEIYIAIDCSNAIYATDFYPNRLEFAKEKLKELILSIDSKISLIAFNKKAYLFSPLSSDKEALIYLLNHLKCNSIESNKVDFLELLKAIKKLKGKRVLIVSSGGEQKSFKNELSFAQKNNLDIIEYIVASKNGAIVKKNGKVLSKSSGEVFYSYLNEEFKNLSNKGFVKASLDKNDIKELKALIDGKDSFSLNEIKINIFILISLLLFILIRIKK